MDIRVSMPTWGRSQRQKVKQHLARHCPCTRTVRNTVVCTPALYAHIGIDSLVIRPTPGIGIPIHEDGALTRHPNLLTEHCSLPT